MIESSVEIGLIYGLVAIAVWLSFRVINFADLSVDGSFVLGAGTASIMIINGYNPWIATGVAWLLGFISGICTGVLHVKFKITDLLSGILVAMALYSVNLRIMTKPNLTPDASILCDSFPIIVSLGVIVVLCYIILSLFMSTEIGLSLRAVGSNRSTSNVFGINANYYIVLTLALSNAIVSFAGALFAQSQGFADISMGTGTIIVGLAAVIIGESFIKSMKPYVAIIGCILGSILYRIAIAIALNVDFLNLQPSDFSILTSFTVFLVLVFSKNNDNRGGCDKII